MGYAVPGAVIVVGVLVPPAWLDRAVGHATGRSVIRRGVLTDLRGDWLAGGRAHRVPAATRR